MKSFNGDPTMFHQLLIYILDAELMQERKFQRIKMKQIQLKFKIIFFLEKKLEIFLIKIYYKLDYNYVG